MGKFTLEFNDKAALVVRELANRHGMSQSDIVRKALNLMSFVDEERAAGNRLIIETKQGTRKEIVPI